MRLAVVLTSVLLAASCARAQDSWQDPWRFDPVCASDWRYLHDRIERAGPISRAALLWFAWDSSAAPPSAASLPAGSRLLRLPPTRPPVEVGQVADEQLRAELAPLADAIRLLAGAELGTAPLEVAAVLSARDQLAGLEATARALPGVQAYHPPAAGGRPGSRADEARRALRLLLAAQTATTDEELCRVVTELRVTSEPGWLAPVVVLALGRDTPRAFDLYVGPALDRRLFEVVGAWWEPSTTVPGAPVADVAALASALVPESGLRPLLEGIASELRAVERTGWRPPTWAEWGGLAVEERLAALDVALRVGAAHRPLPRDAPGRESVGQRLAALGWKALPLLVERATDEPFGPGAIACRMLRIYADGAADTPAARANWWSHWSARGAPEWWSYNKRAFELLDSARGARALAAARAWILERAAEDLGPLFAATMPRSFQRNLPGLGLLDEREREAWAAALLRLERRRAACGAIDVLAALLDDLPLDGPWRERLPALARGFPVYAVGGLMVLLDRGLPSVGAGEALAASLRSDPELVPLLAARTTRPEARVLLLRVAAHAIHDGDEARLREALAPGTTHEAAELAAEAWLAEATAAPLDSLCAASLRRTGLLLGEATAAALQPVGQRATESLARDLLGSSAPLVDAAIADLAQAGRGTRARLEATLRGDVAPLDSGAAPGLSLRGATPGRSLGEPLGGLLRGWTERPLTARDVVQLVAAWQADPALSPGLEVGLSRTPRGTFSARARPLLGDPPTPRTFRLEVDGLRRDTVVARGEATGAELAEAVASAIVDLLVAPDALVDLRLRVWR